ncbi:uncharacterized protein LAESUDRAFT_258782 [Laetiporus sulphureus 93-53]|uniref:Uncharacterized protein n=1 Tax=Laetiporus sulphureus 93-53 TaxID=1314785 RepID=A0A165H4A7_9APHY|nr:uncharacterized protein LAESUDRAFT_258782 [Laetiporus sulphureus 93-53]KZT11223.1 hypothetical protein LAESUDRAFT_258782 [Laetiporus sulphureus 93-53]
MLVYIRWPSFKCLYYDRSIIWEPISCCNRRCCSLVFSSRVVYRKFVVSIMIPCTSPVQIQLVTIALYTISYACNMCYVCECCSFGVVTAALVPRRWINESFLT